jgi:uncharacterized repeat protein (TIGR03803 family)
MVRSMKGLGLATLLGSLAFGFTSGATTRALSWPSFHPRPAVRPIGGLSVERTLYAFQGGSDGAGPFAGLIADNNGALYGTTWGGPNRGTVFKLTRSGSGYTLSTLHAFSGYANGDGAEPQSALIADAYGALYGTTAVGGLRRGRCSSDGCGTVFKLTPSGTGYTETVLHRFAGGDDGSNPYAGVVAGKHGVLYGTTKYSGFGPGCIGGCGTVFKLAPSGSGYTESVLYRFRGNYISTHDGGNPSGALLIRNGALYGTTDLGGGAGCGSYGCGEVFTLTPTRTGYKKRVLYAFRGGTDGAAPVSNLIADASGTLYGTTSAGGGSSSCAGACGTVFRLTPAGSRYTESVLYRFMPPSKPNDGAYPQAGLIMDSSGALYGTTYTGGGAQCGGCGTVFRLTPTASDYSENVLFAFHGTADGAFPFGGLLADKAGALYGTTYLGGGGGGTNCGRRGSYGCGVVFKVIP